MKFSEQIALHFKQVYFGGNWTSVNLKETLSGITWIEATTKLYSFNTIATLAFHIHYYIEAQIKVLRGGVLDAKDIESFKHPSITSAQDWEDLLEKIWSDAEQFAELITQLPDNKLEEPFVDDKYGTFSRNLIGVIEHAHYHLGQIVLLKKMIKMQEDSSIH